MYCLRILQILRHNYFTKRHVRRIHQLSTSFASTLDLLSDDYCDFRTGCPCSGLCISAQKRNADWTAVHSACGWLYCKVSLVSALIDRRTSYSIQLWDGVLRNGRTEQLSRRPYLLRNCQCTHVVDIHMTFPIYPTPPAYITFLQNLPSEMPLLMMHSAIKQKLEQDVICNTPVRSVLSLLYDFRGAMGGDHTCVVFLMKPRS